MSHAETDAEKGTDRVRLIEAAVDAAHLEVDTALPRRQLLLRIRIASSHDLIRQSPAAHSAVRKEHERRRGSSCKRARTQPPLHWAMCPMRLLVQAGSVSKLRVRAAACSAASARVQGPRRTPRHCHRRVCGVYRLGIPTHYAVPLPFRFESEIGSF